MIAKTIGIDIDGVLTDESHPNDNIWHDYLCRYLGKDIDRVHDSYNFQDAYQLSKEVIEGFLTEHLEDIYDGVKPCPLVRPTLERLSAEGFNIILITARHNEHRPLTEAWLARHEIPYTRLYHNDRKAPLAEKENIQLFIEDNGNNTLDLIAREIPVILVNKYHNQFVDPDPLITRVNDWNEIRKEIFRFFQLDWSENVS